MAVKKLEIKCAMCDKTELFTDSKDVSMMKWKIIAWNVATSEPICTCTKCDYNKKRSVF